MKMVGRLLGCVPLLLLLGLALYRLDDEPSGRCFLMREWTPVGAWLLLFGVLGWWFLPRVAEAAIEAYRQQDRPLPEGAGRASVHGLRAVFALLTVCLVMYAAGFGHGVLILALVAAVVALLRPWGDVVYKVPSAGWDAPRRGSGDPRTPERSKGDEGGE